MSNQNSELSVPESPEPSTSSVGNSSTAVKAAVRKLDTGDPFFYVVDLNVPGAALISPESILAQFRSSKDAHDFAKLKNDPNVARSDLTPLCDHPRLVPRYPCKECSGRDPLKARFG